MEIELTNAFSILPDECLCEIFNHLSGKDIAIAELACQRFRDVLNDPQNPRFRAYKYFTSFDQAPEGTFEKKCAWAVGRMKIIEQLLSMGGVRINRNLYKVNDDFYLYFCNGKFEVLVEHPFFVREGKIICISPGAHFIPKECDDYPTPYDWVFLLQNKKRATTPYAYKLSDGPCPIEGPAAEEVREFCSDPKNSFIEHGYEKMKGYTGSSREIFLKSLQYQNFCFTSMFITVVFFIKEDGVRFFKTLNDSKYGNFTGVQEFNDETVIFTYEDDLGKWFLESDKNYQFRYYWPTPVPLEWKNRSELSLNLVKLIRGQPVSVIEKCLNDRGQSPWLGFNESLIKLMEYDRYNVDSLNLTHQQLIAPLVKMVSDYQTMGLGECEYNEIRFSISYTKGEIYGLISPFGHKMPSEGIYTFTNLNDGKKLQIHYVIIDSIHYFGFYGGVGSKYRVSPQRIARFFNMDCQKLIEPKPYQFLTIDGVSITDETGTASLAIKALNERDLRINDLSLQGIPTLLEATNGIEIKWVEGSDSIIQVIFHLNANESKSFLFDLDNPGRDFLEG